MKMMMSTSSSTNHHNQIISEDQEQSIFSSSTCPITWKVYNNPFYASNNTSNHSFNPLKIQHLQRKYSASAQYIHHLHQSDLKMSSFTNISDYYLNQARTQFAELKSELEMERKLRKKMEILNEKLSKELIDQEEKSREEVCVYEDLNKEISRLKEKMEKMKKDMEEERKMLRVAEVVREERVQMKQADAHLIYNPALTSNIGDSKPSNGNLASIKNENVQRKASPEAENPHIKQGIKGFVEFQRAIKARNGSNNSSSSWCSVGSYKQLRDLGSYSKVECQKAQLRVFFKHKCVFPYSHHQNLILS